MTSIGYKSHIQKEEIDEKIKKDWDYRFYYFRFFAESDFTFYISKYVLTINDIIYIFEQISQNIPENTIIKLRAANYKTTIDISTLMTLFEIIKQSNLIISDYFFFFEPTCWCQRSGLKLVLNMINIFFNSFF